MRNTVGNSSTAKLDALDLAQLVLGLLLSYPVDGVAALGVVNETEVLASLLDGDHIHEAGGVGGVGADFAVNLDEALHEDGLGLAGVEGIFEAIAEEDDQGHAVTELVRTRGSLGSIGTCRENKVNFKFSCPYIRKCVFTYRTACPGASARGR